MQTLAAPPDMEVWGLYNFGSALTDLGLDAYLPKFLDGIRRIFSADGASIFLIDQQDQRFQFAASGGELSNAAVGASFSYGEGIAGRAAKAGLPMLLEDPNQQPLFESSHIDRRTEIGSSIIIPLVSMHGTCEGVLNIARRVNHAAFSAHDLERARALASQLALAVANARLIAELSSSVSETKSLHERLQAAVDGAGFALYVMSANGCLELWNRAAIDFAGGPLHSQIDWDHLRTMLPQSFRTPLLSLETSTDQQSDWRRIQDTAGSGSWTMCATRLSDGSVVVSIQDVSEIERMRAEEARLRRLAEIGQMSAAIAHDIRNPLTGIVAAATMIYETAPAAAEFAHIIKDEARKLNLLCDDFLDFSKPIELRRHPICLSTIVERVVSNMRSEFDKASVQVVINSSEGEDVLLLDAVRLEQVIHNLLSNALQASTVNSTVYVHTDQFIVTVADSGVGMTSDELAQLFTPFYTTKAKGTGLGLCNVRKIIEAHGASIHVVSKQNEGTEVRLDFSHVC